MARYRKRCLYCKHFLENDEENLDVMCELKGRKTHPSFICGNFDRKEEFINHDE